ncbi:hypothetical protein GCM10011391_05200 [Pullulanibacillus camelliae]|uniref:Uncharacterized protein n=1 Tax=Pullulanibacillus camelliae TaxID=1707096 RepID=A0A8J2VL73_9BACL|nr:hypothetical protein GCM10011391_05200 [Pullulanibacillus camelliae]
MWSIFLSLQQKRGETKRLTLIPNDKIIKVAGKLEAQSKYGDVYGNGARVTSRIDDALLRGKQF